MPKGTAIVQMTSRQRLLNRAEAGLLSIFATLKLLRSGDELDVETLVHITEVLQSIESRCNAIMLHDTTG